MIVSLPGACSFEASSSDLNDSSSSSASVYSDRTVLDSSRTVLYVCSRIFLTAYASVFEPISKVASWVVTVEQGSGEGYMCAVDLCPM